PHAMHILIYPFNASITHVNHTLSLHDALPIWEQRVLKDHPHIAIAYNEENQPEGYILYEVKANTFTVKDMAYTSANGWKLLLQRSEEHTSELQSRFDIVCRLLLEKKKTKHTKK